MTPELEALAIARSKVGVREATGNNDGDEVLAMQPQPATPGLAWCAFFVASCYRAAGHELPGNRWHQGAVAYLEEQCRRAGCHAPARVVVPTPGLVVFFAGRGGSDQGPGRHCAIVERVVGPSSLHCIEGNWENAVTRTTHRRLSDRDITGYAWAPRD
jgi:hypothetical protein